MQAGAHLVGAERDQVELDVRALALPARAHERAGIARAHRERTAPRNQVAQARRDAARPTAERVVERDRVRAFPNGAHVEMVLQPFAHAGGIQHDRNAVALQQRARADAGELQQLRRIERTTAQQHFACRIGRVPLTSTQILDAARARAIEANARGKRLRFDAQICAFSRGPQICYGATGAAALARRRLVVARAFLARTVEIVIACDAEFARGGDEGIAQRMPVGQIAYLERTAAVVVFARTALLVFRFAEVRQHLGVTPARVAERGPSVEVFALAANVHQAVDGTRSAEHLAARAEHATVIQLRLRLGLIHPVHTRCGE